MRFTGNEGLFMRPVSHYIRWGSKMNVIAAMSQDRMIMLKLASDLSMEPSFLILLVVL